MKRKKYRPIKSYCLSRGIKLKDYAAKFGYETSSFFSQIDAGLRNAPPELAKKLIEDSGGYIRYEHLYSKIPKKILAKS